MTEKRFRERLDEEMEAMRRRVEGECVQESTTVISRVTEDVSRETVPTLEEFKEWVKNQYLKHRNVWDTGPAERAQYEQDRDITLMVLANWARAKREGQRMSEQTTKAKALPPIQALFDAMQWFQARSQRARGNKAAWKEAQDEFRARCEQLGIADKFDWEDKA